MSVSISLSDQTAIVTGSGRGLGRAHALDLSHRGAQVVVNDVAHEQADAVVAEIVAAGGKAIAVYDSVATPAGCAVMVDTAIQQFGGLDIVVHNAGNLRNGYFESITEEDLDAVLGVHLRGGFFLCQAAYPYFREQGYGRIVLTGSTSGVFGLKGLSNYAVAKAGLLGLCNALALEGAEHGIFANMILPKADTSIQSTNGKPIPGMKKSQFAIDRPALEGRNPPESVAPLVSYLASRECTVNGEIFSACYGRFARVFVGVGSGWVSPDAGATTAEDIREHFAAIDDPGFGGLIPNDIYDELDAVADAISQTNSTRSEVVA